MECWPTRQLSCTPNSLPEFEVAIYPSRPTDTSIGLFCQAEDETLNEKMLEQAGLSDMFRFVTCYRSMGIGMLVALGLGIFGVGLLTWLPTAMAFAGIILGGLGCIAVGVFTLLSNHEYPSPDAD